MAQTPDEFYEQAFVHFCIRWIEPRQRQQYQAALQQEWRSMAPQAQQITIEQIEQLEGALENRTRFEGAAAAQERQLKQLSQESNDERIDVLNDMDEYLIGSDEQRERFLAMIGILKADLEEWQYPPRAFLQCLTIRQQAGRKMLQNGGLSKAHRDEFYRLLRNTPGRKVEDIEHYSRTDALEEEEAKRQANRLPRIPQPSNPPLFSDIWHGHNTGTCRWEFKTMKNQSGGQNEGIDLMYGVDQHETIVTRAVQKRLRPTQPADDPGDWSGDLENGFTDPILKEYATQVVAAEANDAKFILKPLAEPADWGNNDWRLYLEYAPHGDIDAMVMAHMDNTTQVPEAFCWLLFQSLIESALIMKNGVLSSNAPRDWRQIVHRDLKLANVVLALPDENHFPQYPRPRIADFGMAIFTDADDPINPSFWVGEGTPGHYAPEMMRYHDPETGKVVDDWKMLSACNVWGIGLVMYLVMTQRFLGPGEQPPYAVPVKKINNDAEDLLRDLDQVEVTFERELGINLDPQLREGNGNADSDQDMDTQNDRQDAVEEDDDDDENFGYKFGPYLTGNFDGDLVSAVQQCLEFLPDDRPSIEALKEWIDMKFQQADHPLRTLNAGGSESWAEPLRYKPEKERYMLGMAWNAPANQHQPQPDSSDIDEVEDEEEIQVEYTGDASDNMSTSESESESEEDEDAEYEEVDDDDEDMSDI